jgi:hypothetical protein
MLREHRLWEPDPEKLHDEMIARFKAADLDGNGELEWHPLSCGVLTFMYTTGAHFICTIQA